MTLPAVELRGMDMLANQGETIFGVYDSVGKAYEEAKKKLTPGSFMLKSIPVHPEDKTIAFSPFAYV